VPRLLAANNYYYRRGGAETVFLDQNALFEDIGWSVIPFCMRHPDNYPSPWAGYFVDEIEFGQAYSLPRKLSMVPKTIYSLEARRKLKRLLRDTRPDVFHAHNIYHHISPAILGVVAKRGIPVVMTLHDLKLACPSYNMLTHDGICERCRRNRLYNVVVHKCIKGSRALSAVVFLESTLHRLLKTYMRHVSRFVVPSLFYINKLVEWGFDATRFIHIPNFVETRDIAPSGEVGAAFLFAGRLAPEKGIMTLMKAAAQAHVPLWIAGAGPLDSSLRAFAAQAAMDVTFLGYLSKEQLYARICQARAVVMPSEWYENAPLSLMEAYAAGVPVIGARIGGIPELIHERETGLTFTSGSVEDLACALREMAELSDSTVRAMGAAGRAWMEAQYTPRMYRERLLGLYQSLGVASA
jgi:glycosyltransferase involved in cell wall biosynthesis